MQEEITCLVSFAFFINTQSTSRCLFHCGVLWLLMIVQYICRAYEVAVQVKQTETIRVLYILKDFKAVNLQKSSL